MSKKEKYMIERRDPYQVSASCKLDKETHQKIVLICEALKVRPAEFMRHAIKKEIAEASAILNLK